MDGDLVLPHPSCAFGKLFPRVKQLFKKWPLYQDLIVFLPAAALFRGKNARISLSKHPSDLDSNLTLLRGKKMLAVLEKILFLIKIKENEMK